MQLLLLILFVVRGVDQYTPVCVNVLYSFRFLSNFSFNVSFQGKYFWKNNLDYFSGAFFLNSVTFGVTSGIKCYQFNEFDGS